MKVVSFPTHRTLEEVRVRRIGYFAEAGFLEARRLALEYCPKAYWAASNEEKVRVLTWFAGEYLKLAAQRAVWCGQHKLEEVSEGGSRR